MCGIGGILGQIMLCFSALAKHWEKEVSILNHKTIQNFLFLYIEQKLRTEKLTMVVGKGVEDFLNSLEKPLQLNEMRVMKESNYQKFRQILSDTNMYGDPILKLIKEN